MKTSLDLPDDLYRQLKAKSALAGKSVREVATSLFQAWVDERVPASALERADSGQPEQQSAPPADFGQVRQRSVPPNDSAVWLAEWRSMSRDVANAMQDQPGLVDQLKNDRR